MARFVRLGTAVLALCLTATACSDFVSRESAADGGPIYAAKGKPVPVDVLQRSRPLTKVVTASAVIGKSGGRIDLPQTGLRVDFPSNALRGNTRITITAVPGSDVAYTFEPHGLVFSQPVSVRQKFKGTKVDGKKPDYSALLGVFFNDEAALVDGVAPALEIIPTDVEVFKDGIRFKIRHFSGYLVSTGRRSGYISSTGNLTPAR